MDLKHPTTHTPPHSHSTNLLTSTNGKHHHHHHHPPPHTAVAYKQCLKNHAVGIGCHAVDGCGEFMPAPTYNPSQPSSFKCAACGCHRNFHRREPTIATRTHFIDFHHHHPSTSASLSPPSPAPELTNFAVGPHLLLSLGTAAEQNHMVATPETPAAIKISGRKRFRTKFSQDQKEKMLTFAEKVGWKLQRCDDKMVADFCSEIGIRRRVLKVWMHNNKNTSAKKEQETTATATVVTTAITVATGVDSAGVRSDDQENGSSFSS
uniref:ZF-HD homeobox protein n=1 Tax=Flaveria trinervia TaxID=4227 RepID=Q9ARE0_FLATR|nr:ZF-HD homeobox protein [Flaveria trinervia]